MSDERHAELAGAACLLGGSRITDGDRIEGGDRIEQGFCGPSLEKSSYFDKGRGIDRSEPFLNLLDRVPSPLAVVTVTQPVVDLDRCPRARGDRARQYRSLA